MYRIDDPSASNTLPTPETANTEGYWTEGSPGSGIPATLERASWFNMVQEELRAIVVAAGLTPSKTTYNQVVTGIKTLVQQGLVGSIGGSPKLSLNIAASATTANVTDDEIVVATALGGPRLVLANVNLTLNTGVTGIGGVVGGALTAGFAAIYAAYNPTTQASGVYATNTSGALMPTVASAPPSGFTYSALLAIVPMSSTAGQFLQSLTQGRKTIYQGTVVYNASGTLTGTSISLANAVPKNALKWSGNIVASSTGSGAGVNVTFSPSTTSIGARAFAFFNNAANGTNTETVNDVFIGSNSQSTCASVNTNSGTPGLNVGVNSYEI